MGVARRAAAERHSAEVAAGDLRWLLITALVLAATLALFFAALFVYRATGPHAIGWAALGPPPRAFPSSVAGRMGRRQPQPLRWGRQRPRRARAGAVVRPRSRAPCTESAVCPRAPQLASQSDTASAQLSLSSTTSTSRPD